MVNILRCTSSVNGGHKGLLVGHKVVSHIVSVRDQHDWVASIVFLLALAFQVLSQVKATGVGPTAAVIGRASEVVDSRVVVGNGGATQLVTPVILAAQGLIDHSCVSSGHC